MHHQPAQTLPPGEHRVPKHLQVKERIAELMDQAAPGSPLPTERELAERFATSRTTVRQALAALSADGRLERTQGRGTFVAEPKRVLVRQLTSYSEDLRQQGQQPSSAVLEVSRVTGTPPESGPLAELEGVALHRVRRLRNVNGAPLAYEVAHLVGPLPRLKHELERRGSLYQTLREAYGIKVTQVEDLVETILAGPEEADLLGIDVGMPLLLIHRTGWDAHGQLVEFTRSVFRGDRFSFIARSTLNDPG